MDLSSSRQLDYLKEFDGKILAIATFPESHSIFDILRKEVFIPPRPSVFEPIIFPDGTYIFPINHSGTFTRTFNDFSTATIHMNGAIDYALGTIEDECIVGANDGDQEYVTSVNFRKKSLRHLFAIPQDEEIRGDLLHLGNASYVQTVSFDGVRFREVWTGKTFLYFEDVHHVNLSAGISLTRIWKEDLNVELHCKNLKGDILFIDKFLSHVPLTWSYNEQGTFLAINGSNEKIYTVPQFDCIYADPMCRWIQMSKCGRFAGAQLVDRLVVLSLHERAISFSLELNRYWSHFEILPGGNLVLFDNRGLNNEKFEWKLARNPNVS